MAKVEDIPPLWPLLPIHPEERRLPPRRLPKPPPSPQEQPEEREPGEGGIDEYV